MHIVGLTDPGRVRASNEDYWLATVFDRGEQNPYGLDGLVIVADGMGGHESGEAASQIAARAVHASLSQAPRPGGPRSVEESLRDAFRKAHAALQALFSDRAEGGGTTLTVVAVRRNEWTMAHVGDSRACLFHRNGVRQLSRDHSLVAREVEAGRMTEEQARRSPFRSQLTQAVGRGPALEPDIERGRLGDDEFLVVCTDGLYEHVTEAELFEIAAEEMPAEELCRRAVALANERGGADNITLVVVAPGPAGKPLPRRPATRATLTFPAIDGGAAQTRRLPYVIPAALISLMLGLGVGLLTYRASSPPLQPGAVVPAQAPVEPTSPPPTSAPYPAGQEEYSYIPTTLTLSRPQGTVTVAVESGVIAEAELEGAAVLREGASGRTWTCKLGASQQRLLDDRKRDVEVVVLPGSGSGRGGDQPQPGSDRDKKMYHLKPGWYRVRLVVDHEPKRLFSILLKQAAR